MERRMRKRLERDWGGIKQELYRIEGRREQVSLSNAGRWKRVICIVLLSCRIYLVLSCIGRLVINLVIG